MLSEAIRRCPIFCQTSAMHAPIGRYVRYSATGLGYSTRGREMCIALCSEGFTWDASSAPSLPDSFPPLQDAYQKTLGYDALASRVLYHAGPLISANYPDSSINIRIRHATLRHDWWFRPNFGLWEDFPWVPFAPSRPLLP